MLMIETERVYVALAERDQAIAERDNARSLACALEAEVAKLTEALWGVVVAATDASATVHSSLRRAERIASKALAPVHDLPGESRWEGCTPELLRRFPAICTDQRRVWGLRPDGTCDYHEHLVHDLPGDET